MNLVGFVGDLHRRKSSLILFVLRICLVLLLSSCLYFVMVSHTYVFQPWETLDAHMKSLVVIDMKSYTGDGKHVSMLVLCKTLKCKHAPHSRFNNIHITRLGSCADENITSCRPYNVLGHYSYRHF